ncbi:hypothetical protein M0R45_007565 [Rubus argutus]|uniref:Uncharacterized protein n=1 Tax=Rubus argutus TaxID=59490 RepID=A0AAW1XZ49_RUBAR
MRWSRDGRHGLDWLCKGDTPALKKRKKVKQQLNLDCPKGITLDELEVQVQTHEVADELAARAFHLDDLRVDLHLHPVEDVHGREKKMDHVPRPLKDSGDDETETETEVRARRFDHNSRLRCDGCDLMVVMGALSDADNGRRGLRQL